MDVSKMTLSTIVTTSAQLLAALAQAHSGDTILLAPGVYSAISIDNFQSTTALGNREPLVPVSIRSEFANQQAVLGSVEIDSSSGLDLSDVKVSTAGIPTSAGEGNAVSAIRVESSSYVNFSSLTVFGSATGNFSTNITGITFEYSNNVGVSSSSFEYLHTGVAHIADNGVDISSSMFSYIDDDAIHGNGTSNIMINGNLITDQHINTADEEHPDAIQFFTSGDAAPDSGITITGNTIIRGSGNAVQGIFITDQTGYLPYSNILIEDNTITGELYNGIYVENATSTTIRNNNVISYADYLSQIRLFNSDGVTVADNSAGFFGYGNDENVTSYGNVTTGAVAYPDGTLHGVPAAVPEAQTWIFMILGVVSLGAMSRRRRNLGVRSTHASAAAALLTRVVAR